MIEVLRCGCSSASPCPVAAKLYAVRKTGALVQHLTAQLRALNVEGRRSHKWQAVNDGDAIKACTVCGIQHTDGITIGKSPLGGHRNYHWRKNGSEWKPYPPLPECLSREEALRLALERTKAGNRKRRAA